VIAPIVKTDKNGSFELQVNVTSQYKTVVVARKPGLAMAWDSPDDRYTHTMAKRHFILVMEEPCIMTGKVVDHKGRSVAGAQVQAIPKTSYMEHLEQMPVMAATDWFSTVTNDDGQFVFDMFSVNVSADFWVNALGRHCTYTFTKHWLGLGFEVCQSNIRLVLPRENKVVGHVKATETGKPVVGLGLIVRTGRDREDILNRYRSFEVVSDEKGTFVCKGLPMGKNRIEISSSETETASWISKGIEVTVQPDRIGDVTMTVDKGGYVDVTVVDAQTKTPLADMKINLFGKSWRCTMPNNTDTQGNARIHAPSGKYELTVRGKGYAFWRKNEPVLVHKGQDVSVKVELDKKPSVSGRVIDSAGRPAKGVMVTIHPSGDHVFTDSQGRFMAGYDIEDAVSTKGLCIIARDPDNCLAAVVHTQELDQPVHMTLGPASTVKGKIIDPNGTGVPAARITMAISLFPLGVEILTDTKGCFEIAGMPNVQDSFNYDLSIYASGYGHKLHERIAPLGEQGSTVDVGTLELTKADQSLTGIVVDANGMPVAGAVVGLGRLRKTDQLMKRTVTNESGHFRFDRICAVPLLLSARHSKIPGGAGYLTTRAWAQDVKIVLGKRSVHTEYESLRNRCLPDLSTLNQNLVKEDVQGKPVLVGFWDMEQRPSRRSIAQLAKKAKELKDREIAVVLIQTAKIKQEPLDQWLTKNEIPFKSTTVEGDFEETRLVWGVKSLPWLILTDEDYKVVAEGFTIAELSQKLK